MCAYDNQPIQHFTQQAFLSTFNTPRFPRNAHVSKIHQAWTSLRTPAATCTYTQNPDTVDTPPTSETRANNEIVSSVYFRTADGRSLFAESLATAVERSCCGSNRVVHSADSHAGGFDLSSTLGATGLFGGVGVGLGLEARQRRARIDSRHRDRKRKQESYIAKMKAERTNDEVLVLFLSRKNSCSP